MYTHANWSYMHIKDPLVYVIFWWNTKIIQCAPDGWLIIIMYVDLNNTINKVYCRIWQNTPVQLCPDTCKSLLLLLSAYSHFVCTSNSWSPHWIWLQWYRKYMTEKHLMNLAHHCDLALKAQHFNLLKNTPAYGDVTSNWDWLQKDQQFWRQ